MSRITAGKGFVRAWKGQLTQGETNKIGPAQAQLHKGPGPSFRGVKLLEIGIWWPNSRVKRKFTERQESWLDLGFALTSSDSG